MSVTSGRLPLVPGVREVTLNDIEIGEKIAQGGFSVIHKGTLNGTPVAIKKIFEKMYNVKKDWKNDNAAKFICCMTLFFPNGKSYSSRGMVIGKISTTKKGKNGFGYDPIFIPDGYNQTFAEMELKLKMSIDHRFKAFFKIKKLFD